MAPMTFLSFAIAAGGQQPMSNGVQMSTGQLIITLLSVMGVGSIGVAALQGFLTRKKLGADATEVITKAASGVVETVTADNARLRIELAEERKQRIDDKAEFRKLIEQHTATLQLHAAWDHMAYAKMEEAGITGLPSPPPLYSPDATPSSLLSD